MKNIAGILAFLFISFLLCPTIVVIIDKHSDVSYVFSMTEEEQSKEGKTLTEFTFHENDSNHLSIDFLSNRKIISYKVKKDLDLLYPEVISPPPDIA
jgi:hypothetical protein